jgi:hypothetical protein
MQHAHVKRKEQPMNRYMLEEFHNDPALRRRLFGEARRERTRAVREGLAHALGGLAWLHARVKALFIPRHPGRWIARLG